MPSTVAVAPGGQWSRWPWKWLWPGVGLSTSHLVPLASAAEGPVPDDRYHAIYFAMLLAGVGFLLPYNSFITDVDYLHHKFPGGSPGPTVTPAALATALQAPSAGPL